MKECIRESKDVLLAIRDIISENTGDDLYDPQITMDKLFDTQPYIDSAIEKCEDISVNMNTPHQESDLYRLVKTQTLIDSGFSKAEIEDQPVVFVAITETDLRNHINENIPENERGHVLDEIYENMPKYHGIISGKFDTQSLNEQAFDIFSEVLSDLNPYVEVE
ncbi:MAG: hypothetical protein ACRC92_26500 [Peptostreptococcaceae bacterium]